MAEGSSNLTQLLDEYAETEKALADPAVHADQAAARRLGRRYAQLAPIVATARELEAVRSDQAAARELASEDAAFAAEAEELAERIPELESKLRELLVPKDPNDPKDVILEIKAGEGGDESALFAGDLLRMYLRYAERQGWTTEVLDDEATDLGGHKSVTVAVRGRTPEQAVWQRLKYEGGVHRVQRVPVTESQGRIHTSAAGVLVLPEAEDVDIEIDPGDLRIDVYRSSGPGGQSVNTTDSAVRITHIPTGTVVAMQNEKSQLQNREAALRVLRARLLAHAQEQAAQAASDARRSQVRTVDRSERVRTYNFAENRIADHRVNFKAYNLDQVLDGALDDVIDALTQADTDAALAGSGSPGSD
ncbi:peptide chain release factor 1 [Jatrophihabitans telluris]|uniref:Peptide chain release factor 1 n=1 Tax=Jatrophihabitans telluris TaxID=2038343 RepID=A0ABY4R237_9ACTN|nr:peptide chain release factor 1 [Jatrophihabitans telluris]UQX89858.1 peptide chain release factor 1 [Jatrophihabitans telluris]